MMRSHARAARTAGVDTAQSQSDAQDSEEMTGERRDGAMEQAWEQKWERVCGRLRAHYGPDTYRSWFQPLKLTRAEETGVTLAAPTGFARDWVASQYLDRIADYWRREHPPITGVEIVADGPSSQAKSSAYKGKSTAAAPVSASLPAAAPPPPASEAASDLSGASGALDPRSTFEHFVVGKSNEFAFAAAQRVAESDNISFNPLFLYGPSGLGKTHLMQAIAWELQARDPSRKVIYLSAEQFMYKFVQ
ncbi:MAG: DnaA/Hda family protein, partial [Pseudomonadota bacterium]